ncbi:MAG: phosphatase PAP2 family protein [Candidatus Lindowbacteria bacterium]|nr:phosphatase PAP2 family protein [Candidatus Lindowbacteria bacterium]
MNHELGTQNRISFERRTAPERSNPVARITQLMRPTDIINLSFVFLLLIVSVLFRERVQAWRSLVFLYAGMLMVSGCLIWFCRGNPKPANAFPRRWYPLCFVILIFFSFGKIVHHILPYAVDEQLIAIDYAMFGLHPTVFLSQFLNPYLVDALEVCYASFYFLPVILAFALYLKKRMGEFESVGIVVCLGFYLSYVGNLFFPSSGPYLNLHAFHTIPLEGKWVGDFIRTTLFALEPYRYDCFPSGHVAVTLITLITCYRYERRLFGIMLPVGTGLILSTVFLRYHYVIDVLAGAALAILVVAVGDRIQKAWERLSASSEITETAS